MVKKKDGMKAFADEMMLLGKIQQLSDIIEKCENEKKKFITKYNKTQKKEHRLTI
jgi:hypothetical protein